MLLALLLAIIPYVQIKVFTETFSSTNGYSTTSYWASFNVYQLLFRTSGYLTMFLWLAVVAFIASALMSIGVWLNKDHKAIFWWFGFGLALVSLVAIAFTLLPETGDILVSAGVILMPIFNLTYFVLYLTLPCCRLRTYCPKKPETVAD